MSAFNEMFQPRMALMPKPTHADGVACPKCRFTGDGVGAANTGWKKFIWFSAEDAATYNVRDERGKPLGEALMVACARCNFRWYEPVDKREAEVPAS